MKKKWVFKLEWRQREGEAKGFDKFMESEKKRQ